MVSRWASLTFVGAVEVRLGFSRMMPMTAVLMLFRTTAMRGSARGWPEGVRVEVTVRGRGRSTRTLFVPGPALELTNLVSCTLGCIVKPAEHFFVVVVLLSQLIEATPGSFIPVNEFRKPRASNAVFQFKELVSDLCQLGSELITILPTLAVAILDSAQAILRIRKLGVGV